jgi:multiple sugar transport system substrate-binding protein
MPEAGAGTGCFDRRAFMRLALGAGVSLSGVGSLAGCGGGGGSLGGGSSAGSVVLPANTAPWLGAYQATARTYEQQHGSRLIFREFPYDGLRTAMVNAIRGGNFPFGVFELDEPWTGEFYDHKWVTPIADLGASFKLDPEVITYDALPTWDASKRQHDESGALTGVPLNGNVNLFVYRKDLYDELDLSVPKTFEEAYENGVRAQRGKKVRFGYVARAQATTSGQSITYDFMPLLRSYGADWYTEDWQPDVNSGGAIAAMKMFIRLLSLGPGQPQTVGQAEVIAAMQGGQSIQCHTVAAAASQLEDSSLSKVAGKLGYAVMPAGSTGRPTPTSGVWSLAIPRGLPDARAKASLGFMEWLMGKEGQLVFARNGGIPTRRDTYDAADLPAVAKRYLPAVKASLDDIRGSVRYPFSAQMLPVAERDLASIAAGKTPVKRGLDDLATRLADIARKAGYPS